MSALARADEIATVWPDLRWPFKTEGTLRLVRLKKLGCVRASRHIFFTRELLEDFIARHTVKPGSEG